ncbi:MAG: anti-sigma factor antagonist [Planctomycetota bacterium]
MAELTFDVKELGNIPNAVLVSMAGAIDASTVVNFQSTLENLQLKGVKRFILDMEGIKYVNSTGLGSLVRLADQLESDGGGFALVKIHPKVKVVFDMLGLNAFFKIFPNQNAAEEHFSAGVQPGERSAAPAASAPPPSRPPQQQAGVPNPLGAAPRQTARAIQCENCGVTLRIGQPGNFKCSRCGTHFTVPAQANAPVQFHIQRAAQAAPPQQQGQAAPPPAPPGRPAGPPLQMNLACREEVKQGLMQFVGVLAQASAFPPDRIQALQHCVNEIVSHITQEAYGANPQATYSVLIAPVGNELNIKFADKGRPLNNPALFQYSRKALRMFDLKPHPQGGNILTVKMTAF